MEKIIIPLFNEANGHSILTLYTVPIDNKANFQSDIRRIFEFTRTQQGVYRVTRYLLSYSQKPCPAGVITLRSRAIVGEEVT